MMNTIDSKHTVATSALISAVKTRPSLYCKFKKGQSTQDTEEKKALWNDVAKQLYGNYFMEMNCMEQILAVQKLRIRWTNLKTCFVRELKKQKDPKFLYGISYKRRPYIYYDELLFLKPEVSIYGANNDSENEVNEENDNEDATIKQDDEMEVVTVIETLPDKETDAVPPKPKKPKISVDTKDTALLEKTKETPSRLAKTTTAVNTQNQNKTKTPQVPKSYEKKRKVETVTATNETDSTNFALSLVPMLNMLPIDKRIDAQVSILTVLKKFCSQMRGVSRNVTEKEETVDSAIEIKSEPETDDEVL
ncbi:unnamed protein product [Chrysodeixis includens]|uniref:MADF domain-containing protein n=1 Tax=Chrysodeixis includens TaxID=689277 RepID=A0A9P0BWV9_CHRIL|nr:unnamed protein product [Chrysodeixis includens]